MQLTIPNKLLRLGLILSLITLFLQLIMVAGRFAGLSSILWPTAEDLAFIATFPLFFGAIRIVQNRLQNVMSSDTTRDVHWQVAFAGLPVWFGVTFRIYSYCVCFVAFTLFILGMQGLIASPRLGLILIPSIFVLTSLGSYWSELRYRGRGERFTADELPPRVSPFDDLPD